jgi:hypothetical protein
MNAEIGINPMPTNAKNVITADNKGEGSLTIPSTSSSVSAER